MTAYYNENDPKAAAWLRELQRKNLIAPGTVDERSIIEVKPEDLRGYTQCHFFAGIGVWSYALRAAGWADDRPVWTGSCPCQPFSAAGKRKGHEDERHLWPTWGGLIRVARPLVVFGEQVSNGDGAAWLDHVGTDLESIGYAFGAVSAPACGFGAPHARQRTYFVADAERGAPERHGLEVGTAPRAAEGEAHQRERFRPDTGHGGIDGNMADTGFGRLDSRDLREAPPEATGEGARPLGAHVCSDSGVALVDPERARLEGHAGHGDDRDESGRLGAHTSRPVTAAGDAHHPSGLANSDGRHASTEGLQRSGQHGQQPQDRGPCNGFWSDAVWIHCRDGKARPTQPGLFPLAHGAPARVGRLRGYGNGLVAPQAIEFIKAAMS